MDGQDFYFCKVLSMMKKSQSYIILLSIILFFSCNKISEVLYSQDELDQKIDSLIHSYSAKVKPEYEENYELRRQIEVRQRMERIMKEKKTNKDSLQKNVFSDTVVLRDNNEE